MTIHDNCRQQITQNTSNKVVSKTWNRLTKASKTLGARPKDGFELLRVTILDIQMTDHVQIRQF
jgi:hypothetical protein